jgi:hypothetical protein
VKKLLNITAIVFLVVTLFGVDPMMNPVLADPTLPLPRLPICGDQDGSETPLVLNCPDLTAIADVQTFQVPSTGVQSLTYDFVFREASYNNELGYFLVDDSQGSIDSKKPGEDGYLSAALQRSHVIFPSGSYANTPDQSISVKSGAIFAFFIVQNNTLINLVQFNPNNEVSKSPVAFFSINSLNPDGADHFVGYISTKGTNPITQFGFEDLTGGGDADYDDVVFDIHSVLQPGQPDFDGDGLPDNWELNGVDTDGDGKLDFNLQSLKGFDGNSTELTELDGVTPANFKHKDVYVWIDWMNGHRPDEEALRTVKKAFNDAPVPNEGDVPGINLHIVYGQEISEMDELGSFTEIVVDGEEGFAYDSSQFFAFKKQSLEDNGLKPGMASIFHFALFAHKLPGVTLKCPTRTGNPTGIAPMTSPTDAGSDFIVGDGSVGNNMWAVGGTFMHELGHTLNLGHGGPGILNDENYKPNQLSVMNYSFQEGLIYPLDPFGFTYGRKLDYSKFASDTIPTLVEEFLNEQVGLGDASKGYGTIYYRSYKGHEPGEKGITVPFPNDGINWNGNLIWWEPSVKVNINGDAEKDSSGNCIEKYSSLETYNEWIALNYKTGTIGAAAILVPDPPQQSFIALNNVDLDVDVKNIIADNLPPSLQLPDNQIVQYSDSLSFNVTATDPDDASDTLAFSATGLPNDLVLTDNGDGTATVTGIVNVAPGTYTAEITVTDPGVLSDTKPVNIVVTKEDARTAYTGPLMISTGCATCSTATVPLRATIQDITAVLGDPAYDPDAGNITNATVSFVNRSNNDVLCTSNVILLDPANSTVGTATCNWAANIGSNYGMDYTVGIVVDGYYTRNSTEDDAIVVVSKPGSNFITGGGYFINQSSGGTYAGDPEFKTNFGLNIKFTKKLTNLQGRVTIIVRQDGHVYQIKSTALSSLVAIPFSPSNAKSGTAELIGKATVTDVTDPLNPIAVAGNATLNIVMKDNGEPGSTDLIGISLWSKDGELLFSSNWDGKQTVKQLLNGGNLSIK